MDYEKIISGIAVGLIGIAVEEIKGIIKKRNKLKKPKKRRNRKNSS